MISTKINRQYYYNNFDIDFILTEKLKGQNQCLICKSISNELCKQLIKTTCDELKVNISKEIVVIPIYFLRNENSVDISHWVGLIITRNNDNNSFNAFYVDSSSISSDYLLKAGYILQELKANGIEIIEINLPFRNNFVYDSGPCTILNLENIIKIGKLPLIIDETSIIKQREYLMENLSMNQKEQFLIKISETSIRKIREINYKKSIRKDIRLIENCLIVINRYENQSLNIKDTLINIGNFCYDISHDDDWNTKFDNIRNKYGYIQRNTQKINENGLHFDKLYQLKLIFESHNEMDEIKNDELIILKNNMINMKWKILSILKIEKNLIVEENTLYQIDNFPENTDLCLKNLNELTNQYYNRIALRKIKTELLLLNDIQYNEENRYFISRILMNIGDLANELLEDKINCDNNFVVVLQDLYSIRNKLIHCHKKVESFDVIIKEIEKIGNSINQFISSNGNIEILTNEDVQILKKSKKQILRHLKEREIVGESSKGSEERFSKKNKDDIKFTLDRLILKAALIFNEYQIHDNSEVPLDQRGNKNRLKSLPDRLRKINYEYQSQMEKLKSINDVDSIGYPDVLEIATKDIIIRHSELNLPIKSNFNYAIDNQELKLESETYKLNYIFNNINEELNNFKIIESNILIDKLKLNYITDYFMTVLTQYVRDVVDLDYDLYRSQRLLDNYINELSWNNVFPFDRKLLKQELDNYYNDTNNLFEYFYSSDEVVNSISSILLCNVGISFAKLNLYEQAIGYLTQSINCVIDYKNNHYWIHINVTLANLFHMSGISDKAVEQFQQIYQDIKLYNKELVNNGKKKEIVKCLYDYAICRSERCEWDLAIDLLKEALTLSDEMKIKFKLAEMVYNSSDFDTTSLFEIVETTSNKIAKLVILESFVPVCLSCSNNIKAIEGVHSCINKMEMITNNNIQLQSFYHEKIQLTKLKVIYGNLVLTIETKSIIKPYLNVLELENEAKEIINGDLQKNDCDPTIILISMILCWYHCKINNETFDKQENYFNLAKNKIEHLSKPSIIMKQKFIDTAFHLAMAYNQYSIKNSDISQLELYVKYLYCAKTIQEEFRLNENFTLINLSNQYEELSNQYESISNENNQDLNTNTAILFLERAIMLNRQEIRILNYQYHGDDNNRKETRFNLTKSCIKCYFKLFKITGNAKLMKRVLSYCDDICNTSSPVDNDIYFSHVQSNAQQQIGIYRSLLTKLLHFPNDYFVIVGINRKMIEFCNSKFGIELIFENEIIRWDNIEGIELQELIQEFQKELKDL